MTERDAKDLLDNLTVPVIIVKAVKTEKDKDPTDYRVVYVNKQYEAQTKGFAKPGNSIVELKSILPQEIDWFAVCNTVLKTGECYEDDYLTLRLHVWFHMKVQKYGDDMCVFTLSNVTAVKVKERHLEFLEMNDEKTGMPNSLCFNRTLEKEIEKAEKAGQTVGLIIMNIDNLQSINDFTSREAGDAVIQKSGVILLNMECGSVHSFRLEGDEFALIKSNVESTESIMELADGILSEFCRHGISISMGIALYPQHDVQARGLIKDADLAMHHVKNNNKGSYELFKVEMYEAFLANVQIQKKIITGLERNQFMLYYQPQFYLHEKKLRGFEALIRWHDENGEWHDPMSFIPIAERTNTIQILGKWIIESAVVQLKRWQENYNFTGILSVNVSPVQLRAPLFLSDVKSVIEHYKILPQTLEFEITEGIFISDTDEAAAMLHELQQMGIRISLDDFGTGYSSLRYLGSMPINTLKLDKSFVDSIAAGNEINIEILSSLIPVTRHAGMETIAEGVEQPEQLSILTDIECNTIQGFLWGKPISAERCDRFLKGDESALEKL